MKKWIKSFGYLCLMFLLSLLIVFASVMVTKSDNLQVVFFCIRLAMYPISLFAFYYFFQKRFGVDGMTVEVKNRVKRLQVVLVILFIVYEVIQVLRGTSL